MAANRVLKITNGGEVELFEPSAGGLSYIAVKAPALAASWTLTLPADDGAASSLLMSDGLGVTSWVTTVPALTITTTTTTEIDIAPGGNIDFYEALPGLDYIRIQSPAVLGASWTLTLPVDDGNVDEVLRTDGFGVTSWVGTLTAFDVDAFTSDGITVLNQGTLVLKELTANGANYVSLKAPALLGGDLALTLPALDGGADDVLVTDGAGNLSFKETLASLTITALTSAGITITNEGILTFREEAGHGVNEVTFKAPHALAADTDYTWPDAIVAGNFLQTDVNGVLSWAASAATLQTAYDAGEDIVMIADTIDISQANNNGMLSLTKTGAGAGNCLTIDNDGTGNAIRSQQDGAAYGWYHTQNGASYSLVIEQAGNQNAVYISQAAAKDILVLVKTDVNAGAMISLTNAGTGNDITGTASSWTVSPVGAAVFPGIAHPHSHETISTAGAITIIPSQCFIFVDTNGGAGDDNLDTISGGIDGQVIIIKPENTARTVHVRDNSASGGNIYNVSSGQYDMDNDEDTAMYIYDGTNAKWLMIANSSNGG